LGKLQGRGRKRERERERERMATVPGALIWEIVKKNNSFLVKEFGNGTAKVQFSKEANNLYNAHSYKYSGNIWCFMQQAFVIFSCFVCLGG